MLAAMKIFSLPKMLAGLLLAIFAAAVVPQAMANPLDVIVVDELPESTAPLGEALINEVLMTCYWRQDYSLSLTGVFVMEPWICTPGSLLDLSPDPTTTAASAPVGGTALRPIPNFTG